MKQTRYRLGRLCRMVKGLSPTLKTLPGEYPLVVTAEYRRTSDTWQLEGPAVCIPLISSTGHGDAALHRVHYQEGKFALANLLVALLPNDPAICHAKYLYHLLMTRKDDLLVPLMQGTANVSLKEQDIAGVEVPLPPLPEQRRIVARIEELAAQIHEARTLRHQAAEEAEAILLNMIAPIIGDDWPVIPLEDVVDPERPITYGIVQAGDHIPDGVPYIRVSDMARPELTTVGMLRTAPEIAARYRRSAVREGDIVFAIRATIGKMRFVPKQLDGANLTQGTARIAPSGRATAQYLFWALQRRDVADSIQAATKGSTFKEITLGRLRRIPVPLPPLSAQRRIVAELDALQFQVDALKRLQTETAAELDALLPAILDRAFKGEL